MKFAVIAALALAAATPAAAVVQLDQNAFVTLTGTQSYLTSTTGVASGPTGSDLIQTFTAGLTGDLTQIALQTRFAGQPTTYNLSVYNGNGFTNPGSLVGTVTFNSAQASGPIGTGLTIDVSSLGLSVTAGQTYSFGIVVNAPAFGNSRLQVVNGRYDGTDGDGNFLNQQLNAYAAGQAYAIWHDPNSGLPNTLGADRGFQTYVDVAPVPEPGEWAMIAAGLGIVGAAARRRRKA